MTTSELISGIVGFVNNQVIEDPSICEALLSFDDRAVPAPLTKYYFAFLIGQDKVDLQNIGTEECCQRTQITVSMNCYAPPGESAIGVCSYAERVLERINIEYAGLMGSYEIGTAVIDDYLKALKIPCKLHFQYEQCPAFNISGTVLRPYADFLCKTHVTVRAFPRRSFSAAIKVWGPITRRRSRSASVPCWWLCFRSTTPPSRSTAPTTP